MNVVKSGRLCLSCNTILPDLTENSIEDIAKNHYGKNKCVTLTSDQIELLINYKKIKTYALASSLFIGTTFISFAYSQTVEKHADSCLITGTLNRKEKGFLENRRIYFLIKDSDTIYETRTNSQGKFNINLPKNCEISFSNVKKLISKKTRNREYINLRRAKLKEIRKIPGFF